MASSNYIYCSQERKVVCHSMVGYVGGGSIESIVGHYVYFDTLVVAPENYRQIK